MRIKKLTMQAFGPFKDKTVIDFEVENISSGLLLITGDTGSGKTTIFDAICFALYGESSGDARKINSLRSDFAREDDETFVELEFYCDGKLYCVKRGPEYMRKSKRGDGFTKQNSYAYFDINGRVISKSSAVTREIIDLIGLDYRQFRQVAMLSQGEFTKFLLASTDEKTSIFRKIFSTDIYGLIMNRLKDNLNNIESICMGLKSNINTEREKLGEDYRDFLDDELIAQLRERIKVEEKELAGFKKRRDKLNNKVQDKKIEYEKIKSQNEKIIKFNKTRDNLDKLLCENRDIDDKRRVAEYNRNIALDINNNLIQKENITKKIDSCRKLLLENENEKKKLDEDYSKKKEDFKKIDNYNILYDEVSSKINENLEYLKKINNYEEMSSNLKKYLELHKDLIEEYKGKNNEYLLMREEFYADSAYTLSIRLEDNKPCPVCGSLTHPCPASLINSSITKEEIEKCEKIVNDVLENVKACEAKIDSIKENIHKLDLENIKDISIEKVNVEKLISDLKEKLTLLKDENTKLIKEKEFFDKNISRLDSSIESVKKMLLDSEKELCKTKEELDKLIENNNTSLDEYEKLKMDKSSLIELEGYINIFDKKKMEYETIINSLGDEVKNKRVVDTDKLKSEIDELSIEYKEVDNKLFLMNNSLNNITGVYSNISKYLEKYNLEKKNYELVKKLSDLSNGRVNGQRKITFENYVQSYYLSSVVVEANKRLYKMSDGRYELRRKNCVNSLAEKIGLEFSVFDSYTGKERDTSSLSGGEKFKASLALALGLSDVISMFAGGIKLDFLFVDEGFGSLDQESLNQALNVLSDLVDNEKLVGIISHVSELISRIDKKIIVRKNSGGSTLEFCSL